ncbi:MAG: CHRD domain-containing protein [Planctomycetales bacterium]|nr:CHRD domain-containing protein [Planctomycetales bacterium]
MSFASRIVLSFLPCVLFAHTAFAHEVVYSVALNGASESPSNSSNGTGAATVTFDLDLITMRVQASFSNLSGNVTSAHIHAATLIPGQGLAGVATQVPTFPGFPLGGTSGTYDQTFDLTIASSYNPDFITASGGTISDALNALVFAAEQNRAYLNIHTSAFPSGEIRGFLTAVPEPSSCCFGILACCAVAWRRKR